MSGTDPSGNGVVISNASWLIGQLTCGGCIVVPLLHALPAIISVGSSLIGALWCLLMMWESETFKQLRLRIRSYREPREDTDARRTCLWPDVKPAPTYTPTTWTTIYPAEPIDPTIVGLRDDGKVGVRSGPSDSDLGIGCDENTG